MAYTPKHAVVWTEIPVSDLDAAVGFYNTVFDFGLTVDDSGPNPMAMIPTDGPGVAGHLYPDEPARDGSGPTLHLGVPGKLEDTVDKWKEAGGAVLSEPVAIPPGRFVYAKDLDGNSIGLFEAAA